MEKSENRDIPNRRPMDENAVSANTCIDGMVQETPPCATCSQGPVELPAYSELITEWATIKEDSNLLISLIDQYVTVHVVNNKPISGFVHCIDVRDFNIILNIPIEGIFHPQYIPNHVIQDVVRSRAPSHMARPLNMTPSPPSWSSSDEDDPEQSQARRGPSRMRLPAPSGVKAPNPAHSAAQTEVFDVIAEDLPRASLANQGPEDCDRYPSD